MTLDDVVIYLPDITQYNHGLAIITGCVPAWEAFGKIWGEGKNFSFSLYTNIVYNKTLLRLVQNTPQHPPHTY